MYTEPDKTKLISVTEYWLNLKTNTSYWLKQSTCTFDSLNFRNAKIERLVTKKIHRNHQIRSNVSRK